MKFLKSYFASKKTWNALATCILNEETLQAMTTFDATKVEKKTNTYKKSFAEWMEICTFAQKFKYT